MPLYHYHCAACDSDQEIRQSFHDDDLTVCPVCGAEGFRRVLTPAGVIFKGSGFYVTDNRGKNSSATSSTNGNGHKKDASESKPAAESTGSESKSESKAESKAASKSEASSAAAAK